VGTDPVDDRNRGGPFRRRSTLGRLHHSSQDQVVGVNHGRVIAATARQMGLEVKMVTGDNLAIAREISRQLGLGANIAVASVPPIGWMWALLVWAYALTWLLLNGAVKIWVYNLMRQGVRSHRRHLARVEGTLHEPLTAGAKPSAR
jgi:hypothetical protein